MNKHILIVEDDIGISRFLTLELNHEGYQTTAILDGGKALDAMLTNDFDLIVLDLMLPTMNGIEVLKQFRKHKNTPVIILTARDGLMDKVAGLDLGASDYMVKPFETPELLARIRVCLRTFSPNRLSYCGVELNLDNRTAFANQTEVFLTKKEFDLLAYLMQNSGKVLSRENIVENVWGFEFLGNTNLVDVYIRYVRAKLDGLAEKDFIKTVRGSGYIVD